MALSHAVLAALYDRPASGYELSKRFDVSVANFWHALPQQLYAELGRLEKAGLVSAREVVQDRRPNKRVFSLTAAGRRELGDFVAAAARPSAIKDELLVKVQAADAGDVLKLAAQLEGRAAQARAKVELYDGLAERLRGERDEDAYLAEAKRVGPYLTLARGRTYERENAAWCEWAAGVLRSRALSRAG
jgi:DNA-binding PadR family transcriptional regulator